VLSESKVFGPKLELSADPTKGDQCCGQDTYMVYGRFRVQNIAGRNIRRRTDQVSMAETLGAAIGIAEIPNGMGITRTLIRCLATADDQGEQF
jgi:hypothetical protein